MILAFTAILFFRDPEITVTAESGVTVVFCGRAEVNFISHRMAGHVNPPLRARLDS